MSFGITALSFGHASFLHNVFQRTICNPKLGLVRQCADDIGALLRTMRDLLILFWIFEVMAKVANQVLGFRSAFLFLFRAILDPLLSMLFA